MQYGDPFALMRDLRAMGLAPLQDRSRKPLRRATLMRAAALYAERFADPDGRPATFELVWLSGWAPHEGQLEAPAPGVGENAAGRRARRAGGDPAKKPKR